MYDTLPNIGKVLTHYGADLRRTSGKGPTKCPFHDDSHASAGVDFINNLFNCLACGVGGNSLQIIAQREGVSIREASTLAEGITGESRSELRGEHRLGRGLPRGKGYKQTSSTVGTIRRCG